MSETPTYRNYIAGEWVAADDGRTSENHDPANGDLIGLFPRSAQADVDRAVAAAKAAYDGWRRTPAPKRGEILYRVGRLLEERKEDIARSLTREMGKVLVEARGDVQEAIDMAYYMAGEGRRLFGVIVPAELPNKAAYGMREPMGVVACVTPWNFPVAIPSWKTMAALIAGNTVVLKPATDTPLSALKYVEVFADAGIPAGVLNLVMGSGSEVGMPLVRHPDVAAISFTGSNEVGREVNVEAARNLKRVTLELGGKNAIIVMDDADLDLAVDGILWSAFGTTGQRCTACSRLIVQRGVARDLEGRLLDRIASLRLGHGLESTTDVGPLINAGQQKNVHSYMEVARQDGARILCGGEPASDGALAGGSFYKPTLLGGVTPNMRVAQEEIFGPVLSMIEVGTLDEAIAVNNGTKYGLSSSIFTRDVNAAQTAMRELATGIVYINAGTIGAEIQLPFGGTRGTGNGHREAGLGALEFFTEWKAVYVDYSGKLQRAQIDA
ncbi:MAG: Aldehyde dehydrogenase B [Ktedonobacterales bacterium]|jgi:aldehyde dehydrogenase (NAD+)|nr:MAG: Aldehyde dehydrogenase B [Ktedonobacterales bacterium]